MAPETTRARLHQALDSMLDALDEYRAQPAGDELVRVRDLPFEVEARRELVRTGRLRAIKIGRELFTSRCAIAALLESMPQATLPGPVPHAPPVDDIAEAARRRAVRRAS